jgi:hypothetical protein
LASANRISQWRGGERRSRPGVFVYSKERGSADRVTPTCRPRRLPNARVFLDVQDVQRERAASEDPGAVL